MLHDIEQTRARFVFRVKNPDNDFLFIALDQMEGNLIFDGVVILDLPEGVTKEKAYEIAEYLQNNIPSISFLPANDSLELEGFQAN